MESDPDERSDVSIPSPQGLVFAAFKLEELIRVIEDRIGREGYGPPHRQGPWLSDRLPPLASLARAFGMVAIQVPGSTNRARPNQWSFL